MDLSLYRTTPLEKWIYDLYQDNGIYYPSDLDIDHIASLLNINLVYYDEHSSSCNSTNTIYLNKREQEQEQRKIFFRELCHVLRHAGDQEHMHFLFEQHQELEADWFQMYAAMPFYMILQLELPHTKNELIHMLSQEFKVDLEFAQKRFQQIERRVFEGDFWRLKKEEKQRIMEQVIDYQMSICRR